MNFPEPESLLAPDDVIADRYRIVQRIGEGGMGLVYAAEEIESGKRVAIKTVLPRLLGNPKILSRFERECEFSQRISHSGVLRILEVFKTPRPGGGGGDRPIPCMAMELLEGETLADRLIDGRLVDPDEAVSLVCQMASALTAAHRAGVVHRDLKPDNVFLVPNGDSIRVVLTDFGVARHSTAPPEDSLTASNVLLGTPDYMAPEQLELEEAMPASDIYTMGLVIFEMILGKPPFVADTALKTVFKRVQEEPPSPRSIRPDLDERWEKVILRCLERRPENRYAEAQDVIRVLVGPRSPWLLPTLADRLRALAPWIAAVIAAGVAIVGATQGWF